MHLVATIAPPCALAARRITERFAHVIHLRDSPAERTPSTVRLVAGEVIANHDAVDHIGDDISEWAISQAHSDDTIPA